MSWELFLVSSQSSKFKSSGGMTPPTFHVLANTLSYRICKRINEVERKKIKIFDACKDLLRTIEKNCAQKGLIGSELRPCIAKKNYLLLCYIYKT